MARKRFIKELEALKRIQSMPANNRVTKDSTGGRIAQTPEAAVTRIFTEVVDPCIQAVARTYLYVDTLKPRIKNNLGTQMFMLAENHTSVVYKERRTYSWWKQNGENFNLTVICWFLAAAKYPQVIIYVEAGSYSKESIEFSPKQFRLNNYKAQLKGFFEKTLLEILKSHMG